MNSSGLTAMPPKMAANTRTMSSNSIIPMAWQYHPPEGSKLERGALPAGTVSTTQIEDAAQSGGEGGRHLMRGRFHGCAHAAAAVAVLAAVVLACAGAAPARAGAQQLGELSFVQCFGRVSGCVNLPNLEAVASAQGLAISPNGSSLYVTAAPGVLTHFFVGSAGELAYDGCVSDDGSHGLCLDVPGTSSPLEGARGVAVSPNNASVYLAPVTAEDVVHLFANPEQGQLKWDGCVSNDGSGGACADVPGSGQPLANTERLVVAPDGSSVYVAGRFSVARFSAAPEQGQLTFAECLTDEGEQGCAAVPGTGRSLGNAEAIAISPSGRSLYVTTPTGGSEGDVAHLNTNPPLGPLSWSDCVSSTGDGGFCSRPAKTEDAFRFASDVAVSPGGEDVYVYGETDQVISHLSADPISGALGFDECIEGAMEVGCAQAVPGPAMFEGAGKIAVSGDGRSVYVVSNHAIVVFSREANGRLSFEQCLADTAITGCSDLPGEPLQKDAEGIVVSPSGNAVYVAGGVTGSLIELARATSTNSAPPSGPGAGGSPSSGPPPATNPGTFTAAQLRASLASQLVPKGPKAKRAKVAARRGYTYSFRALEAGSLTIGWYFLPEGAHLARKPRPVLLASGQVSFNAAGSRTLTVHLTREGKRRLAHARTLKVSAKGTFRPAAAGAVTATRTFTLR